MNQLRMFFLFVIMVIMVLLSFTNCKQQNEHHSFSNRAVFVSGLLSVMLAFTVSVILKLFEVKHILITFYSVGWFNL